VDLVGGVVLERTRKAAVHHLTMHAKNVLEGLIPNGAVLRERVTRPVPDAISVVEHEHLVPAVPSRLSPAVVSLDRSS
jgi:hypothetical protein